MIRARIDYEMDEDGDLCQKVAYTEAEGQGCEASSSCAAAEIQPKDDSPVRAATTDDKRHRDTHCLTDDVPLRQIQAAVDIVNELARVCGIPDRTPEWLGENTAREDNT